MKGKLEQLDPRCGVYEIGPEEAHAILDDGGKNRPINATVLARYVRRMKEGVWRLNGQPIILSQSGALLDGQHRLRAILEFGKAIPMVVLYGNYDFKTIDETKPRSGADVLHLALGVNYRLQLQAACRLVMTHEKALVKEMSFYSLAGGAGRLDIDNAEMLNFARAHPALSATVGKAALARSELFPVSAIGAAWYLVTNRFGQPSADAFFEPLLSGAGLEGGDVRLALRKKRGNDLRERQGLSGNIVFAQVCKAWNSRQDEVKMFYLRAGEAFPFIR